MTTQSSIPADGGSLASFIESTPSARHLRVEEDLGSGFYRLRVDEAQRRQAIQDIRCSEDAVVELLRNARDAGARRIFLAVSREGRLRRIVVLDDGDGVPERMHEAVFEPRVTSKLDTMRMDTWGVHGRGMALYSISQNALEARVAASDVGIGASMLVVTDTDALPERADQSTFPKFILSDTGTLSVRGPRNILRTACEFALEHRKTLSLFVGSPAEIAATVYRFGCASVPAGTRAFAPLDQALPLCKRLAFAADPLDLSERAAAIGFDISERTARRIIDGDIDALPTVLERIEHEGLAQASTPRDERPRRRSSGSGNGEGASEGSRAERRARIEPEALSLFSADVTSAFQDLAQAYYLDGDVDVSCKVEGDELVVRVPLRSSS